MLSSISRPTVLLDGDLTVEPLQVSDAPEMTSVLADPELYDFTGGEPPTEDELTGRYRRQVTGPPPGAGVLWMNWVVRVDGSAVGYVQATVSQVGQAQCADLAWVIGRRWQGRGYAVRAVTLMAEWLTGNGTAELTACIAPGHSASEGVAARVGLVVTDTLTDDGERRWSNRPQAVQVAQKHQIGEA